MTTTESTPPPASPPAGEGSTRRTRAFARLVGEREPVAVDTTEPVLPTWLRDGLTFATTARNLARRTAYRARRQVVYLPGYLTLLFVYAPRGAGRLIAAAARYLYDTETKTLQHAHSGAGETREFVSLERARKDHLHARWIVAAVLVGLVVLLLGGWAVLDWLGVLPFPPGWVVATGCVAGWLALGWHGRNRARPLVRTAPAQPGVVEPLRAPVVTQALCDLGNSKMKEPEQIRLLIDVARHGPGYQIDVELPPGVPASWVMEKREELAAALRRELGCVWPSIGTRHPGHLSLFVSDQPMNSARQAPWPLLKAGAVNLFAPVPLFTDQRNRWVTQTIAYTAWIVGAVPRMGKTFFVRQFGLVAGLDVRTKVFAFDLKGTGDLSPLALFAHAYSVGDEDEDVREQLDHMRWVRREMRHRAKLVRELTLEQNPEKGKVTDALATSAPGRYGPIVVCVDECQVWFEEFGDKAVREEFIAICRDLVKRGPALGIIPLFATQKPDANSIPTAIADNASARVCFKVNGWKSNDQVLGTSSHQNGLKATLFAFADKGIAYFRGDGADAQIVRTVHGLDAVAAEKVALRARQLREAAGRLSGDAADEVMESEERQVSLLADAREVMDTARLDRIHLTDLRARLALLRSDTWKPLTVDALGAQLREAGVTIDQVKVEGRNTSGVRRPALEVAATEVLGPIDGPGQDGSRG